MRKHCPIPRVVSLLASVTCSFLVIELAVAQEINLAIPNFYSEPGESAEREQNDPIGTELIDPFTGALNLRYRDLVVPGNGGLDIAITRTYRSLAGQPGVLGPNYGPSDSKRTIFGIGWDISFGRVWQSNSTGPGSLSPTSSRTQCRVVSPDARYNPILELPDGTREPLISANNSVTTYAFITPSRSIGKCIMTSDPPTEKGDGGLVVHSPDGTKYWFNKFAIVFNSSSQSLSTKMAFHPTRIERPNGSYLTITYLNRGSAFTQDYALIDTVTASDDRQVKFEYWDQSNGNVRIKSIRILGTPARQWNYDYGLAVSQGTGNYYYLTRVTRPDGAFWDYDYRTTAGQPGFHSMETVTTPTGLTTTYSYIQKQFPTHDLSEQVTVVSSKVVGGTAPSSTWNYTYTPASVSGTVDKTAISGPESKCTEYQHTSGNVSTAEFWKIGTLLSIKHSTGSSCTGTTPRTETFAWTYQEIAAQGMFRPPNFISTTGFRVPLMNSRVITLDGTTYTTTIAQADYDTYGNPTKISETGNDGLRTTTLGYYQDTTKWIVGPERVTTHSVSGITGSITRSYSSSTGNLQSENRYGSTTSFTYLSNGEVDEQTDPNGHKTKFLNYKRGVPQEIRKKRDTNSANDIVLTQVVDDAGNITSVTNGRGKTTGYGFDGSDQVSSITTPNAGDANIGIVRTYNSGAIGLKSVLTRGTYEETREHNGFGDLTRIEAKDTSASQTVFQQFTYDAARRLKYAYNPNETATNRRATRVYDTIDRVEEIWHPGDSPKIFFDYDPLGKVIRTDERGYKFSTKLRAFGDPSEQWQVETIGPYVSAQTEPESQTTTIARNNLGMVISVSRDNITRSFAFDSRLFPDTESHPETGLTDLGTDNEGKITSKKVGTSLTTTFQYDAFDRLDYVDYPGAAPDIDYDYYGDDLVKTVIRGLTRWDYLYDDNGNLTEEKLVYTGVGTFITNYLPDNKDALTRISYPTPPSGSRLIVDYTPDALGRPTRVGTYVTSLQYWPSGQLKQIHYANNVVTDIGQNERLFPTSFASSNAAGLSPNNFLYGYDAAGNPSAITDYVNAANNKSLSYDGLNQLRTATGPWGSGSLTYDKRGNLKTKVLGSDSLTYNYNLTSNRLDTITGSRPFSFQYDLYANVSSNGARTFTYDDSSNLVSINTSPATSLVYDGNNRRVLEQQSGVTSRYSVYSRAGLRLFEQDSVSFETTDFIYLGSNLVATRAICYNLTDSDLDGIPSCYELRAGLNPQSAADASQDQDGDGLTNLAEYQAGTDFYKSDTDDDGLSDEYEQQYGLGALVYNPTADPDADGLTNLQEFQTGTNPNDADTDNDGTPDGEDPQPLFNPAVLIPIIELILD